MTIKQKDDNHVPAQIVISRGVWDCEFGFGFVAPDIELPNKHIYNNNKNLHTLRGFTLSLRMLECVRMSQVQMKLASLLAERCPAPVMVTSDILIEFLE